MEAFGYWQDGQWTLEIKRKLVTEDDPTLDRHLDNLNEIYYFGVTVFGRHNDITGCDCDYFDMDIFRGDLTNSHINFPHSPHVPSAQKISYEAARICQPVGEQIRLGQSQLINVRSLLNLFREELIERLETTLAP